MKRVTVTVDPRAMDLPQTFEETTGGSGHSHEVHVVNWNVTGPTAAFLLRVRGDRAEFEDVLERDPDVTEFESMPIGPREWYCFVAGPGTSDGRALWETFKRGTLMTVPPARWNADGTYTFTIVGRDADVQAAVDEVPADARVEIDAVGGRRVATEGVVDRLSERQREAVLTAIDLGYYEIPREATTDDVARELDCALSTAAEHLRKAESSVIGGLFGE